VRSDTEVVHVLDLNYRFGVVQLTKLVNVFDQVVGDPPDLLAI